MSGLPSGLRDRLWNTAPDSASAAPASRPRASRGSRRSSSDEPVGAAAAAGEDVQDVGEREPRCRAPTTVTSATTAAQRQQQRAATHERDAGRGAARDGRAPADAVSRRSAHSGTIRRRRIDGEEDRGADERGDHADLQLAGARDHPADDVRRASSSAGARTSEYGSSQRWSGPTSARAMCGTASPTNAIGPPAAVAAPQSRVTATAPSTRVRFRFGAERAGGVLAERDHVQRRAEAEGEQRAHQR